jgi:hypothetical protein
VKRLISLPLARKQTPTTMRILLCQVLFVFLTSISFGQDASYSFEGQLSESQQVEIQQKVENLPGVRTAKLRYKQDSMRGEFMLVLDPVQDDQRGEAQPAAFSPVDLKAILSEYALLSLEFHYLNTRP